jgi:ferredoxin--NADP+ reductase
MDATASTPVAPARIPGELPAAKYTRQTITWIKPVTSHLFSFRITRDAGYRFKPGQFARLGVYRDDGAKGPRYVWRAWRMIPSPAKRGKVREGALRFNP